MILKKAKKHDIQPMVLTRIIAVESNFNPRLTSRAGARGLMQVMPFHFKSHGYKLSQWKDPDVNLELGCRLYVGYRTQMQKRYPRASATEIRHRTLVSYNMGPDAVVSRGVYRSRYSRIIVTGVIPR